MYEVYLKRYQKIYPGETPDLQDKDWASFKLTLKKLKRRIAKREGLAGMKLVDFEPALEKYAAFLDSVIFLDEKWYLERFLPCHLNANFQEIVNKLNLLRNGTSSSNSKAVISGQTARQVFEKLVAEGSQ